MAKSKALVLEHIHFGKVTVKGAWSLDSSGEKYLDCLCSDGVHKLLVSSDYWISDESDVTKAHELFYSKELLRRKTVASKTHKADSQSTKKAFVSPDKRMRGIQSDANEIEALEAHIEDLQIELPEVEDENDYTESETTSEDDYAQALEA